MQPSNAVRRDMLMQQSQINLGLYMACCMILIAIVFYFFLFSYSDIDSITFAEEWKKIQ